MKTACRSKRLQQPRSITASLDVRDATLPGSDIRITICARWVIKVTDQPAAVQPFNDPARYRRYVSTLAKMDK